MNSTQTLTSPTPKPIPSLAPMVSVSLDTIKGSLRNQIGILEENMPRSGSEGYVAPTEQEQAGFAKLVSLIYAEDLAQALPLATGQNYTLDYYVDREDDFAMNYLLREKKPIEKGWGFYAIRMDSTSNIIVEAPHPLYDRRTPAVALDIYRALDAHALLVAGAHRNANHDGSADVAHAKNSIFQSVHEALSQDIRTTFGEVIILQIHGFHTSKHDGYPPAVIGFGNEIQPVESTFAQKIEHAFGEQGIQVAVCTDESSLDLCGRKNVQGSTPNGTIFLHIELDEKIRKNDQAMVAALVQLFGQ